MFVSEGLSIFKVVPVHLHCGRSGSPWEPVQFAKELLVEITVNQIFVTFGFDECTSPYGRMFCFFFFPPQKSLIVS